MSAAGPDPLADLLRRPGDSGRDGEVPHGATPRAGLRFESGLEGLRGLAVVGVLVFHGGFAWASGGFLGVSTFFTLSGFLITSLLLREHASTGTISLRAFWGRRFRRLMPASLVCLAGVVLLFAPFVAVASQLASLRGDVLSSLAYVANWHFIVSGQSYEQLFSAPSPVLHFWSLAIEEQFYVVFPLVMTVLLVRFAARRTVLLWILGSLAVLSTVEMAWLYDPTDTSRVYYGTDTRAAELLVGAVLALLLINKPVLSVLWTKIAVLVGTAALVTTVWLWHTTTQTDSWLYNGGFGFYGLLSCTIIIAATRPGIVKTVLSTPLLRWLGRISYAAYLLHWPIFLWLTPTTTNLDPWPLFALRLTITLTLAELSLHLIEKPIRDRRLLPNWQPLIAAPITIVILVAMTVHVTGQPRNLSQQITFSGGQESPSAALSAAAAPTTTTTLLEADRVIDPPPALPPLLPRADGPGLRVILEGDSSLFTLGGLSPHGLTGWGEATGLMSVANYGKLGCGIARGGMQVYRGVTEPAGSTCADWEQAYPLDLDGINPQTGKANRGHIVPQVIVGMVGTWDVLDRKLAGDDQWRSMGDPLYDAFFARELALAMDTLASRGSIVIWLTHPQIRSGLKEGLPDNQPESDPARMRRLDEIVQEVAATRPRVRVIDLAGYMASRPQGELDLAERPDGIHWSDEANGILAEWLGPQIIDTYNGAWDEITAQEAADAAAAEALAVAAATPPVPSPSDAAAGSPAGG